MTWKEFVDKITSKIIWLNLLLMVVFVLVMVGGSWLWLRKFTLHGAYVTVPDVKGVTAAEARRTLEEEGLTGVVTDSGYNKAFPPGTVLDQMPAGASRVKPGREIYLTTNTTRKPTLPLPDIADNSSMREAEARLVAMGLQVAEVEYVEGDKDWVYGVKYHGKNVFGGDRIPIDGEVTLQVGSGDYGEDDYYEEMPDSALADSLTYHGEISTDSVAEP